MATVLVHFFRSRWVSLAALAVVVLSFVLSPERGLGLPLCQFREVTKLPCLACGLTRSYIAFAHLNLERSAFYHPLGLVLFPFTLFLAALLFVPAATRSRLAAWADRHHRLLNGLGIALLTVFVVNGLGRMIWLLVTHRPSPW